MILVDELPQSREVTMSHKSFWLEANKHLGPVVRQTLEQGLANFCYKGQLVNILGFVSHMVSFNNSTWSS